jgi:hypothetical protein
MPGEFVANCRLRSDMTWQVEFCQLRAESSVLRHLEEFVESFANMLATQESVTDELPFYVSDLPYYQRMLTTGLAVSLQYSIRETGVAALAQGLPNLIHHNGIPSGLTVIPRSATRSSMSGPAHRRWLRLKRQ